MVYYIYSRRLYILLFGSSWKFSLKFILQVLTLISFITFSISYVTFSIQVFIYYLVAYFNLQILHYHISFWLDQQNCSVYVLIRGPFLMESNRDQGFINSSVLRSQSLTFVTLIDPNTIFAANCRRGLHILHLNFICPPLMFFYVWHCYFLLVQYLDHLYQLHCHFVPHLQTLPWNSFHARKERW